MSSNEALQNAVNVLKNSKNNSIENNTNDSKESEEINQEKIDENKPNTPPDVAKPLPDLSKQWNAFNRQVVAHRRQEQELVAREKALKEQEEKLNELMRFREEFQKDHVAFLDKHAGKDWYERTTQRFLKDPNGKPLLDDEVSVLKNKLTNFENNLDKRLEERLNQYQQTQQQQERNRQAVNEFIDGIKNIINTDERFEFTRNDPAGVDAVMSIIEANYNQTGELMQTVDAAMLYENELERQAQKLLSAKKFQTLANKNKQSTQNAPRATGGNGMKTLTNNIASGGPQTQSGYLSDEERVANAVKVLKAAKQRNKA